ncbi:MAG: hypothetical protein ACYC2Y_05685 [Armatimonadota bacterium]
MERTIYRMPIWQRVLLLVGWDMVGAFGFIIARSFVLGVPAGIAVVLFALLMFLRSVASIEISDAGLVAVTALGFGERIGWGEVLSYSEKPLVTILAARHKMPLYMWLPPEARETLVAALREASNARLSLCG